MIICRSVSLINGHQQQDHPHRSPFMSSLIIRNLIPVNSLISSRPLVSAKLQSLHHSSSIHSLVVILGPTGTGKTKLSVDLATRFRSEIINSDKIQVYRGLDITTNKLPVSERRAIPHHLLGTLDPAAGELSASRYRSIAASAVHSVASRGKIPIVVGGSISLINALVSDRFDPFPLDEGWSESRSRHRQRFRYRCCFVWVDVERVALREYLDKRVDEMVGAGMAEELEGYLRNNNNSKGEWEKNVGLNKAIGVPEFWRHFRQGVTWQDAVTEIKKNTWRLATEQEKKIRRLREFGWDIHRVDATGAVRARLRGALGKEVEELRWESDVVEPARRAVEKLLGEAEDRRLIMQLPPAESPRATKKLGIAGWNL